MTRPDGDVALSDRTRFGLHLTSSRRIPAEVSASLTEAHDVVEAANRLWASAEREAAELREQAYSEGFEAGRNDALTQCAHSLVQAQEEAQAFLRQSEARVARLALNALQRIVPDIAADDEVMARLVWQGVRSAYGQAYINVRVHEDKVEHVRERLQRWLADQGNRSEVHVASDPALRPEDVVVESDAGTVLAGLREQLDVIGQVLQSRAEELDADRRG
ncbi:MAG: FliH/SctL family protein [Halochromatium sp.]|uniref:FliH/SctL family protein n=1 Tax=Halochromatium sp. TaxID=2049430 RepID=UPI00397CC64D